MPRPGPSPGPFACSRCGRSAAPGDGPFCRACGRYLAPLQWIAHPPGARPPPGAGPPAPPAPAPYPGPPRYRTTPRWGFRPGPWQPETGAVPAVDELDRVRGLAATTAPLLWATAVVALIAAGTEAWRYVLLVASREGALSARTVAVSDALVLAAGIVAPLLGALAGVLLITWSVRASAVAAERAGVRPARTAQGIVAGWLVPGLNLAVPGAVLAEIEHAALLRPQTLRPRPSRPVLAWWVLWACGVVLAAVVLAWALRDGVQARADGVVLHGLLDLVAAGTAGLGAVLVVRLTRLLGGSVVPRRALLVRVAGGSAGDREDAQPAHDEVGTADGLGGQGEVRQPAP